MRIIAILILPLLNAVPIREINNKVIPPTSVAGCNRCTKVISNFLLHPYLFPLLCRIDVADQSPPNNSVVCPLTRQVVPMLSVYLRFSLIFLHSHIHPSPFYPQILLIMSVPPTTYFLGMFLLLSSSLYNGVSRVGLKGGFQKSQI